MRETRSLGKLCNGAEIEGLNHRFVLIFRGNKIVASLPLFMKMMTLLQLGKFV